MLSADYCHIFKLFLLISLGGARAAVSGWLTTSQRKLWVFVDRLIFSTHNSNKIC